MEPTPRVRVPTRGGHETLAAVETLGVGSAKVPHLPVLESLLTAPDADAVLESIRGEATALEGFARRLEHEGLGAMAATARRAVASLRWNADVRSLLEWVYGAMFKTAGRATMSFAPWITDPSCARPEARWEGGSSCTSVRLPPDVVERAALADALVYERVVGGLNAGVAELGDGASAQEVCALLASPGERRECPSPVFSRPRDLKSLLKVDYKLGPGDDLLLIDVSAGLIGLVFDDDLLDGLAGTCSVPSVRCAPRLLDAVWERFELEHGVAPRSAAVVVLDEEMARQWGDGDLLGLRSQLGRRIAAGVRAQPEADVPVLTLEALEDWATVRTGAPRALAGAWSGVPELLVVFSCRVGELARPQTYDWLRGLGVTIVDERHHGFAAAKELCTASLLGEPVSFRVRLPDTLALGIEDLGGGHPSSCDPERVVSAGWERALDLGWPALAFKIGKLRREGGAGDYPTAYVYPATEVGRRVAVRSFGRAWRQLSQAGTCPAKIMLSRVETQGGYAGPDGRYDLEVRTYAFPVPRG